MSDTPEEKLPDDLIMPYADGVLAPEMCPMAREALANRPDLMELFESFLFTRGPLARPFDAVLAQPIPERLLRIVLEPAPSRMQPAGSAPGASILARIAAAFRVPALSPAFAIPAVVVAVAAAWLAHEALRSDLVPLERRGFAASASLQQALEETPRGSAASLAQGLAFKPTFTFASVQRTWCRQYELTYGPGLRSGGLACRSQDGVWRVIALTEPEPALPPTALDKTIPAAGKADDIIDETKAQIKGGDVLGRDEEIRLIKQRWQTKP